MRARLTIRTSGILACCIFLFPISLLPQMPAPLGRLHITAGKDQKATETITINNATWNKPTPVLLAVVPNTYTIVIGSCPAQKVSVASGQTQEVTCSQ